MLNFSSSAALLAKFTIGLTMAAALVACGGGGGSAPPLKVATADTTSAVAISTVAALVTTPPTVATFDTGFSGDDGTLAATPVVIPGPATVSFTSSSATPAFTITSSGFEARGITRFGSCFFEVTFSTFPSTSPLAFGKVVKLNPCNLKASTNGVNANGASAQRDVYLVLGTEESDPVKLDVTVNPDGTVLIGSTTLGTVTLVAATGATGAGN